MAKAEMSIIKIDGKPLEKLIEVVSRGIGRLYQYREIRKLADAEAYRLKTIAQAKSEADASSTLAQATVQHLIQNRVNYVEVVRQLNLESVVYGAAEELQNEEIVSDEPVDSDWINRFFNIAQEVSNEEMQAIWSKILAGEIRRPRTYSLRTLDFIRNISASDAKAFQKIARYVLSVGKSNFVYYKKINEELKALGLTFPEILYLIELDILSPNDSQYNLENGQATHVRHGNTTISIHALTKKVAIQFTPFTSIGNELLSLVKLDFNEPYFKLFCKSLIEEKPQVEKSIRVFSQNDPTGVDVEEYLA